MRLSGHGIRAELPPGWEGAITARAERGPQPWSADRRSLPVAHLASFGLPVGRGDFGSGAVETMHDGDAFVALLEYGPASADTPLFATIGLPRQLRAEAFSPRALQRVLPGQAGMQRFCTHRGRAFCLYVVLGGSSRRGEGVAAVNRLLDGLDVDPAS